MLRVQSSARVVRVRQLGWHRRVLGSARTTQTSLFPQLLPRLTFHRLEQLRQEMCHHVNEIQGRSKFGRRNLNRTRNHDQNK